VRLPLRRAVFWVHLATGLLVGAIVAVMSLTGVLLAFEQQITGWADRRVVGPLAATGERLPPSALAAAAAAAVPDAAPSRLEVFADPRRPAEVRFGRSRTLLVDPRSGRPLGAGAAVVREGFDVVTAVHRWLGGEGTWRALGRGITGAANLAFGLLIVSGLYLWVPPLLNRRRVRNVAWFRRGLSGRARDFNWHHVFGLWLAVPLLLVVLSGVVISYPWAGALLARLAGDAPPQPGGGRAAESTAAPAAAPAFDPAALDAGWRSVAAREDGWTSLRLDLPEAGDAAADLTVQHGGRGRPDLRRRVRLDLADGEVLEVTTLADESRGRRIRSWLRWIHTGEAGGLAGQGVAALASAGGMLLTWTGWALAWRRLFPRRRRSHDPRVPRTATAGPPRRSERETFEEMTS
jgi:uncharacterized iron-regulated membrane protein